MTMPIDLVLVRHGQSEGNAANELSRAGDNSAYTEKFKKRHSTSFHLTARGRKQARMAGEWLRNEFFKDGCGFDRYVTSECIRAMETAGLLDLPDAKWLGDFNLAERDWGDLDISPDNERNEKFREALQKRRVEPFFWRPPGGETFTQLCSRVDTVFRSLHQEYREKRVLLSSHGETALAIAVKLERLSQERFRELVFSKKREDKIYNCQVIHYTRNNPTGRGRSPYMEWVRWIRPTETPPTTSGWRKIERPVYSNADLLEIVNRAKARIE